jgi:hypothetical protein
MGTAGSPGAPCSLLQAAHGIRGSSGSVPTNKQHPDKHLKTSQDYKTTFHTLYSHVIYITFSVTARKNYQIF